MSGQTSTGRDRELGMDRPISRRHFLQGSAVAVAGGLLAKSATASGASPPVTYPPALTGLRGSHVGSFEVAHDLAWNRRTDWGAATEPDADVYDLVVVGAGVSGLSAAHFYRAAHGENASILLLDNHDDFGGHAKRNEFSAGGQPQLGYGGSQSLEAPGSYSDVAKQLLKDLQVDVEALSGAYDQEFYRRHGLAMGVYFDAEHYGVDRLVMNDLVDPSLFLPLASSGVENETAIAQMPISAAAKSELIRLMNISEDHLDEISIFAEPDYLERISYKDLLTTHLHIRDPQVHALLQDMASSYFGLGADASPALHCLGFGLPGLGGTGLGRFSWLIERAIRWTTEPYTYHFPDGNASVARLLVRRLIPAVASGDGMGDIVGARFDYAQLDREDSPVRLRLGSTAVRVQHSGSPATADEVEITYVHGGRTERVRARHVVLACYNRVIPHLCPELPAAQREALSSLVKVPLVYTNVFLENWRAFRELGIGLAHCPGSYHRQLMIDFPVSLGAVQFSKGPDEPIVLHMNRVPGKPGLNARDQHRAGRHELLATSFEQIERATRTQLAGMLGSAGFDPAVDIAGITVNRWPHGYAYSHNPLFDPDVPEEERAHARGRQRFGRIAIANSDAGGRAYLDCAIDEAHRAVAELR
ncbi:MAG: NAD(P)-binding protein [Deltaproteobacteria bacterium]|nr:NAD(P)-binding protein [Deltaproteobacteria bacterium]